MIRMTTMSHLHGDVTLNSTPTQRTRRSALSVQSIDCKFLFEDLIFFAKKYHRDTYPLAHHRHSVFMFGISIPCLKLGKNPSPTRHKSCIFCNATPENGFDIVWEVCLYSLFCIKLDNNLFALCQDETFMAFNDYKPAAQHHMLVIPKLHVRTYLSASERRRVLILPLGNIRRLEKSAIGLSE